VFLYLKILLFACPSSLDDIVQRLGRALEEHSSLLLDECLSYDEAACNEEQRAESIRRALSGLVDTSNLDCTVDEENAVEWCVLGYPVYVKHSWKVLFIPCFVAFF
jgi:hypothetical protein